MIKMIKVKKQKKNKDKKNRKFILGLVEKLKKLMIITFEYKTHSLIIFICIIFIALIIKKFYIIYLY